MNTSAGGEDLEFRHYLDVLRRRKGVIGATVILALIAGFVFIKLATPVYESTAQVFLEPDALSSDTGAAKASSGSGAGSGSSASPEVASQVVIMKSASVADEAKLALNVSALDVAIDPLGNSTVIGITASANSAKEAARIAQTYADSYVNMRRAQVNEQAKATIDALTVQINALKDQLTPIDQSLNDLNTEIAATTSVTARAPLAARRDQLAQQRQTLDTSRGDLQQRLDRLQLDSSVSKNGGVAIVSNASVPSSPSSPQKTRDLALALALGVILGIAAAFVRDHLDDRITSDEDLRGGGTDGPVLGYVPAVSGWRRSDPPFLVTTEAAQSPAADAYARLGTVLELRGATAKLAVIQVTGAHQGDGKTTTVANLGVALARVGRQVVLVDANLRSPRLHSFFGLGNDRGLTSVLRGKVALADALVEVPDQAFLRVLPSGPTVPNPTELLAGQSARDLITRLRFEGHIVIFDSPSLPASDALVLADRVDGVVLVAYLDETTRTELAEALSVFEHVETPVIGTVLNGTRRKPGRSPRQRRRDRASGSEVSATILEPKYRDSERLPSDAETP